jgi:glycosyltransferase involved in cell wall biosynthesis
MPARRLLIVTYYYPPRPVIGSVRWAAMGEWLRRKGHEVTVVTSRLAAPPGVDDPWVLRTLDLMAVGSLRKLLRRENVPSSGTIEPVLQPAPRWVTDGVVPDEYLLTWVLPALAPVRRVVREREIDCVITTGPPHSTHLLPLMLGRRRPAWMVDLRDGWRFMPLRPPWPTRAQDRLDAACERVVARSAEQIIGISQPMAVDAHTRLAARAAWVPNGWDLGFTTAPEPSDSSVLLDHERVNVVYTGTLSGPRGRDPRPVFEALRRLATVRPAAAARLRLVLAGKLSAEEERMLSELDLGVSVEHLGVVSRNTALALQREADVLLLLTSPTDASDTTGKLFEYLAAGRPILALASGNEAARIVEETRTGTTLDTGDVDGIVRALEASVNGTFNDSYAPCGLSRYTYPQPAEDVAALVEKAITQRTRTRSTRADDSPCA